MRRALAAAAMGIAGLGLLALYYAAAVVTSSIMHILTALRLRQLCKVKSG